MHKTFRRRPGRLLNVLRTFNLRPVSTGNRLCSTSHKRVEYVSKTCEQERFDFMIHLENVLKTSLQDVLKMSLRRLQNVLNTSSKRLEEVFANRLKEVLKTS